MIASIQKALKEGDTPIKLRNFSNKKDNQGGAS